MFIDFIPKPVVLDVSLRDGGYLNNWMFDSLHIQTAIDGALNFGADIIEVGYIDDREGLPVASSWRPQQLELLNDVKKRVALSVMCRPTVSNPVEVISSRKDLIDIIRIPVDLRNTQLANRLADICEKFGLPVTFNLTSVSLYSLDEISKAYSSLSDNAVGTYIADSRGALVPDDIPSIIESLKKVRETVFGFHAHNNLGLAAQNTIKAVENGCSLIDGSLFGIGLGGRNLDLYDAVQIAKMFGRDMPEIHLPLNFDEVNLGVQAPGKELPVYRLSGERNFKMEWVMLMIEQLGIEETARIVAKLPRKEWFSYNEVEHFIEPEIWRKIVW
jgi:4-hydroxy 2-oxovalerate aldolase